MKALQLSAFGPPHESVALVDLPEPVPGPGEVLVAVEYAPIHPSELLMILGRYGVRPALPASLGQEGVGRVLEITAGVNNLKPGDRVLVGHGHSAWRERLCLPASGLVPLPAGADPQQLSMLSINPPTAGLLLDHFGTLEAGDWVIQNAANSGVGRNVIAFARKRGLRTVNVVRREELIPDLEAAGSDVTLLAGADLHQRVAEATGRAKIRIAFDALSGDHTGHLAACLAPGGKLVLYAAASGRPSQFNALHVIFQDKQIEGLWLLSPRWRDAARQPRYVAEAAGLVAQGALHVPVAGVFPLDEARQALSAAQGSGKFLFRPS